MKRKQLVNALSAIGLSLAVAGPAAAAIVVYSPIWAFQDDDIEYIFDNDSSGTITKGDTVLSVGKIPDTQGTQSGQGPSAIGPEELTFVADFIVATAIDVGGVAKQFVLAPNPAGVLAGYGATVMVAAFTDATADLNVINGACGTRAACAGLAGLGATTVPGSGADGSTLFALIGYGDPDDLWVSGIIANGNTSIATIAGGGASTAFVNYSYGQSLLLNNTGVQLATNTQACAPFCSGAGDGKVDVTGSGNLLGGAGLTAADWNTRSDNDFQAAVIPEPGTLALLGAALAGIAGIGRRKVA